MYRDVVTETSPDRNGQTEMSRDRKGPDRNGQTEKSCSETEQYLPLLFGIILPGQFRRLGC